VHPDLVAVIYRQRMATFVNDANLRRLVRRRHQSTAPRRP
jgi:hypothetical protein